MLSNLCTSPRIRTARGVWISGPPGVGKSTELFGWGMYQATRADIACRRNLVWIHQTDMLTYFVRVHEGVVSTYCHPNLSGDALINTVASICVGANLLLFDAIKAEMQSIVTSQYIFRQREDIVIVACTSYSSGHYSQELHSYLTNFDFDYTVNSWTWAQYVAAHAHGIFPGILTIDELQERFYYCGGCLRHMLLDDDNQRISSFYMKKISEVVDYSRLLKGLAGVQSVTAINSLVQILENTRVSIVSEFVMKQLADKVQSSFVPEARKVNAENASWQGWVFELDFLRRLQIIYETFILRGVADSTFSICVDSIAPYDHRITGNKITPKHQSVYLPTAFNQGCFGAVYCRIVDDITTFFFLKATIATKHAFNFQYIANFLASCYGGVPGFREDAYSACTLIRVVMMAVVNQHNFSEFASESISNTASVHCFDPTFTGVVSKYFYTY